MNNITLAKKFVPLLDETYRLASLTSVLDGNPDLIRQGANWGELIIPIMNLQGLGNYDRSSGYVEGDVTLTYETIACNYDRARPSATWRGSSSAIRWPRSWMRSGLPATPARLVLQRFPALCPPARTW